MLCYTQPSTLAKGKDTSIKAIILRHVSRLKPSVFMSLSVEKKYSLLVLTSKVHLIMTPIFPVSLRLASTFFMTVLSSLAQICMSWKREEWYVIVVYNLTIRHPRLSRVGFIISFKRSSLSSLHTYVTSNLLVNGSEVFFFFSLLLRLE